jgi:hypothetical protein
LRELQPARGIQKPGRHNRPLKMNILPESTKFKISPENAAV